MKTLLTIIFLMASAMIFGQKINIENTNVDRYFKKGTFYNCAYEYELYKFYIIKNNDLNYSIKLYNCGDSSETKLFKDIDNNRIVNIVVNYLLDSLSGKLNRNNPSKNITYSSDCKATIGNLLYRQIIDDIFGLNISNKLLAADSGRINVGCIYFKHQNNKVACHQNQKITKKLFAINLFTTNQKIVKDSVTIDKIQIAFEDGIIKDMVLKGTLFNNKIEFKNFRSFSIRNPSNINELNSNIYYLFADYNDERLVVNLSDVIFYERNVISGSGTYIPKNDTISLSYPKNNVQLYKDSYINNFDIRLYSDVTGFNKNNPNGIIQFDCKLDLILSTQSMLMSNVFSRGLINSIASENSFIFFNKISPYVIFSKIEDNQKALPLSQFLHKKALDSSYNYATTFDLYKYSNLNLGVNLNVFTLLTQSKKFRLNLSGGLLRTLTDSTLAIEKVNGVYQTKTIYNQKNLTSWYLMPELEVLFIESDRIEFEMKYGFIASKLSDNDVKQSKTNDENVGQNTNFKFYDPLNWIHKIQASINIHPNPKNKESSVFMRSTYYFNRNDNNLSLQIGYATSITNLFNQFK